MPSSLIPWALLLVALGSLRCSAWPGPSQKAPSPGSETQAPSQAEGQHPPGNTPSMASAPASATQPAASPARAGVSAAASGYGSSAEASPEDDEPHDDVGELDEAYAGEAGEARPHPLDDVPQRTLEDWLLREPAKLGSVSIGRPNGGALLNGVRLTSNDLLHPVAPGAAWATEETRSYLLAALEQVHRSFENCPPLFLGDISAQAGGPLKPHLSHQSGRDVDIAYFYSDKSTWYTAANAKNLDLPRTWAFVRALITHTDVELILIDQSLQGLLREFAEGEGEDPRWLADIFRGTPGLRPPLIRHARGHRTHLHIRFYNPIAQESAYRLHELLVKHGKVRPRSYVITYVAQKGDTLTSISKRFGVSIKTLQRTNRLKSTKIIAKKSYVIPKTGTLPTPKLLVPPRRLPPAELGPTAALRTQP